MININGAETIYPTVWDDLRFPFIGRRIDTTSGRIAYDFDELGLEFASNTRYDSAEQISFIVQFPHDWKIGSVISPHIHWTQTADTSPNWLIEYRWYDNGDTVPSSWIKAAWEVNEFTYTSGSLLQLTEFPDITPPENISGVSSILDIKFYRDVANASGEFSGAEDSPQAELVKEFDIHYQRDSHGSVLEYTKWY